MGFQQNGHRP